MAGKLVPCKACGQEIAKGVKKCPNCGKDQRNFFMRHKIITFILAVVVIIIIGNMIGEAAQKPLPKHQVEAKQKLKKPTISVIP